MKSYNITYDYELLRLILDITTLCNFRCEYCFNYKYFNKFKNITIANYENIIKHFSKFKKLIHLGIQGGEPLLYKDIKDLTMLVYFNEFIKSYDIFTNGSIDIKNKIYFNDKLTIYFSIHPSQLIKNENYINTLKQNLLYCKDKCKIIVQINNYKLDKINDLIDFVVKNKFTIAFNNVYNPKNMKQIKSIKSNLDNTQHILYNDKLYNSNDLYNDNISFKNWNCYINSLSIDVFGNVYHECLGNLGYYKKFNYYEYTTCKYDKPLNLCCLNYYKESST